jgi:3-oxoacyl-[acyl-carrier-protein] synthase-3
MTHITAGIRSIALGMPETARTNEFWRTHHPDLVADADRKRLARVFAAVDPSSRTRLFDEEMQPYLGDPFRGSVERRVVEPGAAILPWEVKAARDALAAARLTTDDVDLLICCSFIPDHVGLGHAAFLCGELGLKGTAWNLEATCSSALHALHAASALVGNGAYRTVLVVVSVNYSKVIDERNTLAWNSGDGAAAFVVSEVEQGGGILGFKSIHTAETCGAFYFGLANDTAGAPVIRMDAASHAGHLLREHGEHTIRTVCLGAAEAAGVALADIDFFVFPTPVPWYSSFGARVLGIDPARTISTHGFYCNIGPVLPAVNLYHAAESARIDADSLVLVSTIGSVSSAAAAVMRWGQVALGPTPVRAVDLRQAVLA